MARKVESKTFKVAGKGEEVEASEVTISITPLDGNTGGLLGIKLLQLFGPSIVGVIAAMETDDLSKVSAMASDFFTKMTPAEFKSIRDQLFAGGQVQELGEFSDLNAAFIADRFAGHVGSLYALVFFALKVNFRNFFDDLGIGKARINALIAKVETSKAMKKS